MKRFLFLIMLMNLSAMSKSAIATETQWISADYLQARLLADSPHSGALELRLAKGWHAYWKMPGDGGLAPVFDWDASDNIQNVDLSWPVPRRFQADGLQSFGYEQSVLFPLSFRRPDESKPAQLKLDANIMVCETICVPQSVRLMLELPGGELSAGHYQAIIRRARDDLPSVSDTPTMRIDTVAAGPEALAVGVWSQKDISACDLFVDSGDVYLTAAPKIASDIKETRRATLSIAKPEGVDNLAQSLTGKKVSLTFVCGDEAVEKGFTL